MTKERKNYVLDTNVILHDPLSFFNFKNATIFIPFIVIYELDKLKKDSAERGYHARQAIRILEDLRKTANLVEGVPIKGNSIVKVVVANEFSDKAPDDYILHVTLKLKAEYPNITLVTKDFNLRIKADTFKINVEDYQEEIITKDSFYKGWRELEVSNHDLKNNLDKIMPQLHEENPFNINEFILFKNSHQDYNYRIFRHTGDNKFQEASYHAKVLWQLMPKNPYQAMVIDLLMDDSIPLVILCGPSGTGKTFLVLACLLYKVIVANVYQRLLVSRPLVPLGPDIGFLPGDLQEKLQTWMQPIKDNLDFLVHHINQHQVGNPSNHSPHHNYDHSKFDNHSKHDGHSKYDGYKKKKSYFKDDHSKKGGLCMEDLIGYNSKVSLEAITYMRGRSIPNQAIFIDEVQNLTPHEVKTLISRVGEGSKIVLAGDPYQIDSPYLDFTSNGLIVACEKFKNQKLFGTVYLQISERSALSALVNDLM